MGHMGINWPGYMLGGCVRTARGSLVQLHLLPLTLVKPTAACMATLPARAVHTCISARMQSYVSHTPYLLPMRTSSAATR